MKISAIPGTKQTLRAAFSALLLAAVSVPFSARAQMLNNEWASATAQTFVVPSAFALTITDLVGTPVAGAQVMIGDAPDVPFAGNTLTADANGRVALPATWLNAQPVTIEAPGFVRTTYLAMQPTVMTLQIRTALNPALAVPAPRFELKGTSAGFGNLKNDGVLDIGFIVQAVSRAALSTISLTSLISPEVDHFTVFGQSVDVPSNITFPDQTESYIFPLRFNKPDYRLYLPKTGAWKISALHAQMPFKSTVDAMRSGKSFMDIVNTFDFTEGSVTDVTISQPSQTQDVVVNSMPFTKSIDFMAPTYDPGLNLLAISLAQSGGSYYPTDIKNVAAGTSVQLSAPAGTMTDGMILAAFKKVGSKTTGPATDQYTAVTLPNSESRPFDPIRLVNPPQILGAQLILDTPTAGAELNPVMTYALLNIVTTITRGNLQLESKQAQWDVWAPNWVNTLTLPQRPLPGLGTDQKLRWEVSFSAQFTGQKATPPGPGALEKITHVTRSAVDL